MEKRWCIQGWNSDLLNHSANQPFLRPVIFIDDFHTCFPDTPNSNSKNKEEYESGRRHSLLGRLCYPGLDLLEPSLQNSLLLFQIFARDASDKKEPQQHAGPRFYLTKEERGD